MNRQARPEKMSLVAGASLCAILSVSLLVLGIGKAKGQGDSIHEITREQAEQLQANLTPAELHVSPLRSSEDDLASGFHKHSVPAGRMSRPALVSLIAVNGQGPEMDYSTFKHTSQRHSSLACNACHQRADTSAKPSFPDHPACINCHGNQFYASASPLCSICHADMNTRKPTLKSFPVNFKESFNIKFDHAQHMSSAVRPKNGCGGCHSPGANRGTALSIPASLSAHNQCYVCHTPASKSTSGHDLASCGVCHDQKNYIRTATNAPAFRASFSHAKHGPRQRLECVACHQLTAGLPQGKQVSSPRTGEHFSAGAGQSCMSCHNGKRSFGGDLAFKDCRRCHAGATFRLQG